MVKAVIRTAVMLEKATGIQRTRKYDERVSDPEAGLSAQQEGRPRDHLASAVTQPIPACSLPICMPVMRRTNPRAYQNDSARHPSPGVAWRAEEGKRALALEGVFYLLAGILQA